MTRILATLDSHSFDISATELGVFSIRHPRDAGRRPRVAMRHDAPSHELCADGLERRNYLRRQAGPGATMQVRLTAKGWAVVEPIRRCVGEIGRKWIAQLGERRFWHCARRCTVWRIASHRSVASGLQTFARRRYCRSGSRILTR